MVESLKGNQRLFFKLLSTAILGAAFIIAAALISNTDFYIRDSASAVSKSGEVVNVITVSGDGKVYGRPDMATINLRTEEISATSTDAISEVNKRISEAKKIALEAGVEEKDLQTDHFSIWPRYNNDQTTITGYTASQSLSIIVRDVSDDANEVSNLLDQLSQIDKVGFNGISFDIEDKTELFSQARELAYGKAEQKGSELAKLGGLELLEPVSISDVTTDYSSPASNYALMEDSKSFSGSDISLGQVEVVVKLDVNFGIQPK